MDLLKLWELLANNPLNITLTFNVQITTAPYSIEDAPKEFLHLDPLSASSEDNEEFEDEPLGFDVRTIVGKGK